MTVRKPESTLIAPGSPEWYKTISASKVPAIMGKTPKWDTPYSLYKKMRGELSTDDGNAATSRGHYLEPAILAWFADQKPEHEVGATGTWRHPDESSWIATPDGTWGEDLVEAKSAAISSDWGKPGTAEIPEAYLIQALWQMYCVGARRVWFPVLVAMSFQMYVVEWDDVADALPAVLDRVRWFQSSVEFGLEPPIDGGEATYQAVRNLHPDLTDDVAEIPEDLAVSYAVAIIEGKAAEAAARKAKSELAAFMGTARKAVTEDGIQVAYRGGKAGSAPSLTNTAGVKKIYERKQ